MDFWITIIGLLGRKRVMIPAIVVAVVLGATAYLSTPVRYTSQSLMVLTPTEFGGTESQDPKTPTQLTNPMLNFNDSLKTTSAILIQAMNTEDIAKQVGATGGTQLVIDDGRTNPDLLGVNGPFLYVVGRSTSPAEAKRVVVETQTLMRLKLRRWQSSLRAPEKTFVSLEDVVPPSAPEADRARAIKLGILAAAFGYALSMGIAYFLHSRRARRARAAAEASMTGTPPPEEDDPRDGGRASDAIPVVRKNGSPAPVLPSHGRPIPVPSRKIGSVPSAPRKVRSRNR